jgi:hypothetical protein
MRQAKLPADLHHKHISDMKVGDKGYTVPWDMQVDDKRYLWIDGQSTFDEAPGGSLTMHIIRHKDGFIVDIPESEMRWIIFEKPSEAAIPVIRLMRDGKDFPPQDDQSEE